MRNSCEYLGMMVHGHQLAHASAEDSEAQQCTAEEQVQEEAIAPLQHTQDILCGSVPARFNAA